ncbi:DUF6210 family protein [Tenggerimyces flavus]|uniref:DUF6210 family protein n=1 Tax=Tenggerimyces flavus TaxID=1708749 RepID=A0ABV7Y3G5_9ACTN|nr:DUF6210 family protein [Tenggerimyces flavus]MBM7788652.1 hypothetical protein [Tenggerimyces flavus]
MRYYDVFEPDPLGDIAELGFVIVHAKTGVGWFNQYGGYKCKHGRVEGFLLPTHLSDARPLLDQLFLRDLAMSGSPVEGLTPPQQGALATAVEKICVGKPTTDLGDWPLDYDWLRLDPARIAEADEAWVPVLVDGEPGTLVWMNSD